MPHTKLLAKGNPIQVDPDQSQLAQLDVSAYSKIRLSAGNEEDSPGPVLIAISQIDQPNTQNANAIALVDSFTLAPGESASKAHDQDRCGTRHQEATDSRTEQLTTPTDNNRARSRWACPQACRLI